MARMVLVLVLVLEGGRITWCDWEEGRNGEEKEWTLY